MIWVILSALVCLALIVKLLFFTDIHRHESKWFYRVILFLTALYAGRHVVNALYTPDYEVSVWRVCLHLSLFVGAFFIKPHHLPWNQKA